MKNKMNFNNDSAKAQNGIITPPSVIRPTNANEKTQKSDTKSKK